MGDLRGVMSVETAAIEMEAVAALSKRCRDPVYHMIIAYCQERTPDARAGGRGRKLVEPYFPGPCVTFNDITFSTAPSVAGNVQWDGKYMAVGDQNSTIYRTHGSNVVSSVTLSTTNLGAFYIVPSRKRVTWLSPVLKSTVAELLALVGAATATAAVTELRQNAKRITILSISSRDFNDFGSRVLAAAKRFRRG